MKKREKVAIVIAKIAVMLSIFGVVWGVGRIFIHDIPTIIRGYDYVVIETEERNDYMAISHDVATKKAKRKIEFKDGFDMLINDFIILLLSVGVLIIYPTYKEKNNLT